MLLLSILFSKMDIFGLIALSAILGNSVCTLKVKHPKPFTFTLRPACIFSRMYSVNDFQMIKYCALGWSGFMLGEVRWVDWLCFPGYLSPFFKILHNVQQKISQLIKKNIKRIDVLWTWHCCNYAACKIGCQLVFRRLMDHIGWLNQLRCIIMA